MACSSVYLNASVDDDRLQTARGHLVCICIRVGSRVDPVLDREKNKSRALKFHVHNSM